MSYTFSFNDLLFMCQGAVITFLLTIVSGAIGTFLGFMIGWGRSINNKILYYTLGVYIDVIRTIPLILQFVLFNSFMAIMGYPMSPFISGIITLSLYISGYVSEVVTAGIKSVPIVTRNSARGLGMTYMQDFINIVIPIGVKNILPSWVGLMLGLMKDTSLIAVMGATPPELLRSSQIIINRIHEPIFILLGAGVFYYVMCYSITRLADFYENKEKRKMVEIR
tara:strand:+ start:1648 stop:2316 length:669 start_codon:yes stop_codon:yes gene_type:complete